jgi:hypothetical protein
MRLASSEVSLLPERPFLQIVPAMDRGDHNAACILHHERIGGADDRLSMEVGNAFPSSFPKETKNRQGTHLIVF